MFFHCCDIQDSPLIVQEKDLSPAWIIGDVLEGIIIMVTL